MLHRVILPGEQRFDKECWANDIRNECYFDDRLWGYMSGPLCTLCSQAVLDTTQAGVETRLGYPCRTSTVHRMRKGNCRSNYKWGGPQLSEHLSIEGRVEGEDQCERVSGTRADCTARGT